MFFFAVYRRKDSSTFKVSGYIRCLQTIEDTFIIISATETSSLNEAEKNSRFKANLLNAVGQAVIATDLNGHITYWNRMAEQMYGWSEAEVIGRHIMKIIPVENSEEQAAEIKAALIRGKEWTGTVQAWRKDGTSFPALITNSPYYDEAGNLSGITGVATDVTERIRIDDEIKASEARYRTAQEQGKLGHWVRNLKDDSVIWSDEIYNIFELSSDIKKLDFETYMSFVHPDDKEVLILEIENFLNGIKPFDIVHRIVLPNGSIRYTHDVAELVTDEVGQPIELRGMVQDVTEQQLDKQALSLSERNYRLLFDENPVPLWMLDVETLAFINVNEAAIALYGYTREEFLKLHLKDIRIEEKAPITTSRGNKEYIEEVVKHRTKDGKILTVNVSVCRIKYDVKKVSLGTARDITAELMYEKKLKESQQQLSLIFNNTVDSMWLLKVDGPDKLIIETANKALIEQLGIEKITKVGYLLEEALDTTLLGDTANRHRICASTGIVQHFITESLISKQKRISEITIIPLKDENEKIIHLLGISRDVTKQHIAEQKLLQSEEKYRILFEKSPLPKWIFDMHTLAFLEVNEAAIKHYGYSKEEFLTMGLDDMCHDKNDCKIDAIMDDRFSEVQIIDAIKHRKKNGEVIIVTICTNYIRYNNVEARMAAIVDRTEQERAKEELLTTAQNLRELASHLQNIREQERADIAREIHDELGQQLTGLKMDISWVNKKLTTENEAIRNRMKTLPELVDTTINSVRKIAAHLRPGILDDLGLAEAISWHGTEFSKRTGIHVNIDTAVQNEKISPAISIALFRIFQESLTNVARYANASVINCRLMMDENTIHLYVADNGTGFNTNDQSKKKTLGLLGIKERVIMLNGNYTIKSVPGKGTEISTHIPLIG